MRTCSIRQKSVLAESLETRNDKFTAELFPPIPVAGIPNGSQYSLLTLDRGPSRLE